MNAKTLLARKAELIRLIDKLQCEAAQYHFVRLIQDAATPVSDEEIIQLLAQTADEYGVSAEKLVHELNDTLDSLPRRNNS